MSFAEKLGLINIIYNYTFNTKLGRKWTFDIGVWASKGLIIIMEFSLKVDVICHREQAHQIRKPASTTLALKPDGPPQVKEDLCC